MIGMSQSFITQLTCYDSLLNGRRPSPMHLKKCWRVMVISCMPKSSLSSKLLRLCDSRKLAMPRKRENQNLTIQVKTLKYVWPFSPFFKVYAPLTAESAPSDTIALFANNCQVGSHATSCVLTTIRAGGLLNKPTAQKREDFPDIALWARKDFRLTATNTQ